MHWVELYLFQTWSSLRWICRKAAIHVHLDILSLLLLPESRSIINEISGIYSLWIDYNTSMSKGSHSSTPRPPLSLLLSPAGKSTVLLNLINNNNNNNMQVLIKRIKYPTTSQCAAAYYYSIKKIVTIISLHLGWMMNGAKFNNHDSGGHFWNGRCKKISNIFVSKLSWK